MTYRLKPVVIHAVRWDGPADTNRVLNWLSQMQASIAGWTFHDGGIILPCSHESDTSRHCLPGCWIVRHADDYYSTCAPEVFNSTYEATEFFVGIPVKAERL